MYVCTRFSPLFNFLKLRKETAPRVIAVPRGAINTRMSATASSSSTTNQNYTQFSVLRRKKSSNREKEQLLKNEDIEGFFFLSCRAQWTDKR